MRAFAVLIADEHIRRMGGYVDPSTLDLEGLYSYLVERALVLAPRFDPSYGFAFTTFLSRRLRLAITDWFRQTRGDTRYGTIKPLSNYVPMHRIADEHEAARLLVVEEPEPDSLAGAIIELGRNLSPDARWALVNVAGRMAEGATETTAIRESLNGIDFREAKRRLKLLREELRSARELGVSP